MSAGFSINVKSNADRVVLDLLAAAKDMPEATARALNRTVDQGKVAASREVKAAGYSMKIGEIKKAMRLKRATKSELRASIIASGRPIPLIQFSARQTSKGVSVNVLKGRKLIEGAFIATMPSGHRGVFVREPGAKHRKVAKGKTAGWHALPIRELWGPSIPAAVANEKVQQALLSFMQDRFPKLLDHEVKWRSRRVGR